MNKNQRTDCFNGYSFKNLRTEFQRKQESGPVIKTVEDIFEECDESEEKWERKRVVVMEVIEDHMEMNGWIQERWEKSAGEESRGLEYGV
ncbi:hypothetical protein Csa_020971 [Cucumis sativus]|uniref:Uncharacterized protein n=1 Tax=Cucumis sativus TaxID=3659 RepID=A0A0A0KC68_CUCSA|nr:hypothetical protein Csa_020971 [Cucumis sativus]